MMNLQFHFTSWYFLVFLLFLVPFSPPPAPLPLFLIQSFTVSLLFKATYRPRYQQSIQLFFIIVIIIIIVTFIVIIIFSGLMSYHHSLQLAFRITYLSGRLFFVLIISLYTALLMPPTVSLYLRTSSQLSPHAHFTNMRCLVK